MDAVLVAIRAALAAPAEGETRKPATPGWRAAYEYDGPVSVGGLAADLGMLEPPSALSTAERAVVDQLAKSLDILLRACKAGAYVGSRSPAVTQAEETLATLRTQPAPEEPR